LWIDGRLAAQLWRHDGIQNYLQAPGWYIIYILYIHIVYTSTNRSPIGHRRAVGGGSTMHLNKQQRKRRQGRQPSPEPRAAAAPPLSCYHLPRPRTRTTTTTTTRATTAHHALRTATCYYHIAPRSASRCLLSSGLGSSVVRGAVRGSAYHMMRTPHWVLGLIEWVRAKET
jgi:hypothetical protein